MALLVFFLHWYFTLLLRVAPPPAPSRRTIGRVAWLRSMRGVCPLCHKPFDDVDLACQIAYDRPWCHLACAVVVRRADGTLSRDTAPLLDLWIVVDEHDWVTWNDDIPLRAVASAQKP